MNPSRDSVQSRRRIIGFVILGISVRYNMYFGQYLRYVHEIKGTCYIELVFFFIKYYIGYTGKCRHLVHNSFYFMGSSDGEGVI